MPPRGGDKRGIWHLESDGSGTWTRIDPSAVKFRDLWMAGPSKEEVTMRKTYDHATGELLGVTHKWLECRDKCADLPSPRPPPLRTEFHFSKTRAKIPPEAMPRGTCGQEASIPSGAVRVLCLDKLV